MEIFPTYKNLAVAQFEQWEVKPPGPTVRRKPHQLAAVVEVAEDISTECLIEAAD